MSKLKQLKSYPNVDLKLGIKSSMPNLKESIALLFLFWESKYNLDTLIYSESDGSNKIQIASDVFRNILEQVKPILNIEKIDEGNFLELINSNQLFHSQIEALIVTFELCFGLARFSFVDDLTNSAERTGGNRFVKRISFTTNMDYASLVFSSNRDEFIKVLLNWLGLSVRFSTEIEEKLITLLTLFNEKSIYKISYRDDNGVEEGIIFNNLSIYEALLEDNQVVDLNRCVEPKGSLRILKNIVPEGLNRFLSMPERGKIALNESQEVLLAYKNRLDKQFEIDNKKGSFEKESEVEVSNGIHYDSHFRNIRNLHFNRIFFGAPGTGKSFSLEEEKDNLLNGNEGLFERVTFHPDYSYSQFVGTYKPVPKTDGEGITYKYVPGPFMRILVEALKNSESENPYLLIVEEINRANVASVFGDIFQLLDRKDGISEYAINLSEDMKGYIIDEFSKSGVEINPADLTELKLPNNLFIWATMNSADQGVFLMDTAFKRRWEFERFGINDNEEKISDYVTGYGLNWNALRKTINDTLSANSFKINEDKLMGPFFLKPESVLENVETKILNSKEFNSIFKNKVLMYLFDDAVKQKRAQFFADGLTRYSQICEQFDKNFDEDGKLKDGTELKDVFSIFRNSESLFNDYQNFLSSTQNS
ncbi:McrB family protein [Streptococcus intermedius]|uniref:McrB family protein n=1 Tax=Streptococcus intermedius TaxID=1338 RepID=UPI000E3E66D9|nr:AAA family ATPase [Streptococcus intermedius]